MKIDEKMGGMRGILELTFRDKKTGKIIDEEKDFNVFLQLGMSEMLQAFTEASPGGGSLSNVIQSLRIGDDVGSGSELNPQPAQATYTGSNQNEIYTIDYEDFVINYPNYYSAEITTVIDGDSVMALYPEDVDKRFTSAALYTGGGNSVAYRRFQARTITRQVVIDVKWTLLFDGQGG